MMCEADPAEFVLVDKHRPTFERLRDVSGVQRAMDAVRSVQNIPLSVLDRSRRVPFVDGDGHYGFMRRLARRLEHDELAAGLCHTLTVRWIWLPAPSYDTGRRNRPSTRH